MKTTVKAGESDSGVLLTPQQVAARLSVSLITVKRLLCAGQLQGLKIGRVWRVTEADLMAYLQRRRHVQTMSREDHAWLEAEFTPPLLMYEWGPNGPPTGQSIRVVGGIPVVEGGKGGR